MLAGGYCGATITVVVKPFHAAFLRAQKVEGFNCSAADIMRYEVQPDGTSKNGRLFFDMTNATREDALDGLKVDR
jgi:hypothetical protein